MGSSSLTPDESPKRQRARDRAHRLRERIAQIDLVCSGTLHRRTKVCGKPTCACATDDSARHGPYWEWSRRENGRLAHNVVSPATAAALKSAIRNQRRIRRLLVLWERESLRIIRDQTDTT